MIGFFAGRVNGFLEKASAGGPDCFNRGQDACGSEIILARARQTGIE
ncbi:MAG: hypothetical protein JW709_07840 [Sedimentisphaerales bacterium]|nr:hypothetical protein [Sedimentisphaerales bacterium]